MIDRTLAHYQITSKLGEGGMGVVYRAEDRRLGRQIALKVLPDAMAGDQERLERFRREARTLATLNHPNIVTIFSVEEDAGTHFLTMELVEGRGLDDVLAPGAGLDREDFFEVAVQLADALAAAHGRGVVHRDLKPANLKLDGGGRLKVLDFGLAKLADAADASSTGNFTSNVGQVVGTTPYMSPEQARGQEVDERSDVFAIGTVLYELATGRRPFAGPSVAAILHAITHEDPEPVSSIRPDLSALDPLLRRCHAKDSRQRCTAAEIHDDLQTLLRGASVTDLTTAVLPTEPEQARFRQPVIAVLPFGSRSKDVDIQDFATSLGNDVIDGVTGTSQAVVLPASATRRFADHTVDAREVGEEVQAGYIVLGTVRCGGDRLRVSTQLVAVETGKQIWSRHYDRDLADIDLLSAGDEIAAQITSAVSDVHGVIFEVERQRLEGRPVSDLDPWECIFVTLGYDKFLDAEHHKLAQEALERALELDPAFPLAWGYLSWITTDEELHGFNTRPDAMPRAMAAARRAVELDPNSHMLRWLLARVHFFNGDVEGFLSEGDKALELNSSDATVIGLVGFYTAFSGHWSRGKELIRRAMALNPSHPSYYHLVFALDYLRLGSYEEALAEHRRINFRGNPVFQGVLTAILAHLGRKAEAADAWCELSDLLDDATPDSLEGTYRRWNFDDELTGALMDGIALAGDTADEPPPTPPRQESSE